jgi:hypothetical protein
VYYFFEVYKDQAALEAHCNTPHYALWREVADVLEGPLAATSTAGALRRLGGTRWQWMRRLVYVIGLWPTEPTRCRPVLPATPAYWAKTNPFPFARLATFTLSFFALDGKGIYALCSPTARFSTSSFPMEEPAAQAFPEGASLRCRR